MTNHTTAAPEPVVQATRYEISCLPEGHDDRITYSINIHYEGDGLFSVRRHALCQYSLDRQYSLDGEWVCFEGVEAGAEWVKAYRFDHDTALRLAKKLASTLSYRGRTVADVLAAAAVSAVSGAADSRQA